jgi:hypothetical protein
MAQIRFPDARSLGRFTASLLNGGGRHTDTEISTAEVTAVISWFEEHLGPLTKRFDDKVVWQWKSPGRVIEEVWVKPFTPDRPGVARDLSAEELSTYRTTIVYEYHVLPPPWWQFWRRR